VTQQRLEPCDDLRGLPMDLLGEHDAPTRPGQPAVMNLPVE
jgi:hypothetical protein